MARAPGAISVARPALEIRALNVAYGRVPILHDLSLTLERGVIAVVGRNGMGKTTLCKTIMGLVRAKSGSIRVDGAEIANLAPNRIARSGVAYVPQGRRVWPSLSVEEHLRLAFRGDKTSAWTLDRIWDAFPRLAERRGNGGGQLSGGEQQMLAISRALLANPRLLIMDEPTEGLAPVIVEHVERMLKALADEGSMSILLIEQNLGVALDVADRVAIMLHGEIARDMASAELAADADLQRRLLGVGRHAEEMDGALAGDAPPAAEIRYLNVTRQHGDAETRAGFTFAAAAPAPVYSAGAAPTRFSADNSLVGIPASSRASRRGDPDLAAGGALPVVPVAVTVQRSAYVVGTFDTKRDELTFLANSLRRLGLRVVTVDLATSGRPSPADISPREVGGHHPDGAGAVFSGDRGRAVTAMATAFEAFMRTRRDVGGIISAGGSGGTALATAGMRALPIGIPKFMVSTVASADVSRYVGPSDISMMYSVTDVQGINRISEQVLANAAHALAGMIGYQRRDDQRAVSKPAIGMTMFGVTTPCVQAVQAALREDYDCLVFHATGTGGRSMEKLVDSRLLVGVLDITTTEIPDLLVGGVFAADEDRMGAIIRHKIPYVGSCGALDMVNFNARDTVPSRFQGRNLYIHNPNVTLMRTTVAENEAAGRFIAERLNRMEGPVRFLIPLGGVSLIDAPGKPFHDPAADRALFSTIERLFAPGRNRRLIKVDANINDPAFSSALVQNFRDIMTPAGAAPRAAHR